MKTIAIRRFGGPEVLETVELPAPQPGAGEVLLEVKASSINPVDWKVRRGDLWFITGRKFPKVLGLDLAGVDRATGRRLFGMTEIMAGKPGAFAEAVAVRESRLSPIPDGVTFEQAAALPSAGLGALFGLREHGELKAGERVLINGASGGVGTYAVQLAKLFGAHVTAVTSARNHELVSGLGADRVIDYSKQDFRELPETFDLVFDIIGNAPYGSCKRVLGAAGRWVTAVPTPGAMLRSKFVKRARTYTSDSKPDALAYLAGLVAAKKLAPVIEKVVQLEQLRDSMAQAEQGRGRGKTVVTVSAA
jgi:NADPH:quinone reductase-like Zn-dependent oxidoreductase